MHECFVFEARLAQGRWAPGSLGRNARMGCFGATFGVRKLGRGGLSHECTNGMFLRLDWRKESERRGA
jgi:hypothetical protein